MMLIYTNTLLQVNILSQDLGGSMKGEEVNDITKSVVGDSVS